MTRRSRILWFGSAALLVLAGIAGAIAFGGTLGQVLALALIGLGLVLATGLVFLEVGLSEDRERSREQAQRSAVATEPPRSAGGRLQARLGRPRLARNRGSRRKLG